VSIHVHQWLRFLRRTATASTRICRLCYGFCRHDRSRTSRRAARSGREVFQPFDAPFNDGARLEGFLCQKPNHTYGTLALLRVDGWPAPQRIFATPKLHYPFGKDGSVRFPAIHTAHLYEKLDRTNVLSDQRYAMP
jgi:hypothetical protein